MPDSRVGVRSTSSTSGESFVRPVPLMQLLQPPPISLAGKGVDEACTGADQSAVPQTLVHAMEPQPLPTPASPTHDDMHSCIPTSTIPPPSFSPVAAPPPPYIPTSTVALLPSSFPPIAATRRSHIPTTAVLSLPSFSPAAAP